MADIFISYASDDLPRAEPLARALEELGWSVWWDRKIPPGKTFSLVIEEAIYAAKCVIVLWSNASIKSDWVQNEAAEGSKRGILVPALIDDVKIPFEFRRIQAADLTDWKAETDHPGFTILLGAVSEIVGPSPLKVKEAEEKRAEEESRSKQEQERKLREEEQQHEEAKRKADEERKRKIADADIKPDKSEPAKIKAHEPRPDATAATEQKVSEPLSPKPHKASNAIKFSVLAGVAALLIIAIWWYISPDRVRRADPKPMKAEKQIAGRLEKLKDKPYYSHKEFIMAARKAVGLPQGEFEVYQELIAAKARQQTFALTQQSIDALKNEIANPIVDDLQKIQNIEYSDKDKFITAVDTIIENMVQQFYQYLPSVLKYAKVWDPYRISEKFLKVLSQRGVPAYLIAKLKTLPKAPYPDIIAFKKAVRPIIEDVTIGYNFPDPIISELVGLREEVPENQRKEAGVIIQEQIKKAKTYEAIILEEIDKLPLFLLTDQSFKNLQNGGFPNDLNLKLHELKNKGYTYTDQNFFEIALKNKIDELAGQYQALIVKYAVKKSTYQLTELSLGVLQIELEQQEILDIINKESIAAKTQRHTFVLTQQSIESLRKDIANPIVNDLQKMQNSEYPDKDKFVTAVDTIIENMVQQFYQYLPSVLKYAKVWDPYRISEKFLKVLSQRGVSPYLIAKLKTLPKPKEPYPDIKAFKNAVRLIIEDVTIGYNFPDPIISKYKSLREEVPENQRKKADVITQEEIEKHQKYETIILNAIEELPLFMLTVRTFKIFKINDVPNDLNFKLHELDKGYTDQNFFEIALKNKIVELAGQYQALIVKYAVNNDN